jgi:hypothetical protein
MPKPQGGRVAKRPAPRPEQRLVPLDGPLYFNASPDQRESIARIMVAEKRTVITNVLDVLVTEALTHRKNDGGVC